MLRATTACTFSCLIWPAGSAPRRFSEPTFRPSGATNHWKNTLNRDFPIFSRIYLFFLLTLSLLIFSLLIFSLLTLPTSAFQLSILSEVSLLNFLRPIPAGDRMSTICQYARAETPNHIKAHGPNLFFWVIISTKCIKHIARNRSGLNTLRII